MKNDLIDALELFRKRLLELKKLLNEHSGPKVSRKAIRTLADDIATMWVEVLRSPLEHRAKLPQQLINNTAESMRQLHILSRPNNLKSSYVTVVSTTLKNFDNNFILPIKQTPSKLEKKLDLDKLVPGLLDAEESDYLRESIDCAVSGYHRAAIVMGWCATISRIQKLLLKKGLSHFNAASKKLKLQTTGKFKNWNKEFNVNSLSELQTVFDTDLIVVMEGMSMLDGNQAERLKMCFQFRNHSAHPSHAPITEANLISFFSDITSIVLQNPQFSVS